MDLKAGAYSRTSGLDPFSTHPHSCSVFPPFPWAVSAPQWVEKPTCSAHPPSLPPQSFYMGQMAVHHICGLCPCSAWHLLALADLWLVSMCPPTGHQPMVGSFSLISACARWHEGLLTQPPSIPASLCWPYHSGHAAHLEVQEHAWPCC